MNTRLLTGLLVLGAILASTAGAQSVDLCSQLGYRIDGRLFDLLIDGLGDDHVLMAQKAYEFYGVTADRLENSIDSRLRAVGLDEVERLEEEYYRRRAERTHTTEADREWVESFRPQYLEKRRLASVEITREIYRIRRTAIGIIDDFLNTLAEDADDPVEAKAGHWRITRRYLMDRTWPNTADFTTPRLHVLIQDAGKPDGQILLAMAATDDAWNQRLEATIKNYEHELDLLLESRMRRQMRVPTVKEILEPDEGGAAERGRKWYFRYQLVDRYTREIAELLREVLGDDPPRDWMDAFHSAMCPQLFADRLADELVRWARENGDLTEDQTTTLHLQYAGYLEQRRAHRTSAFNLGVTACRGYGKVIGVEGKQMRYARAIRDLHEFNGKGVARLLAVLTQDQRRRWDSARIFVLKAHGENPTLLNGPVLPNFVWELLADD